jgi:hypothetical protein
MNSGGLEIRRFGLFEEPSTAGCALDGGNLPHGRFLTRYANVKAMDVHRYGRDL